MSEEFEIVNHSDVKKDNSMSFAAAHRHSSSILSSSEVQLKESPRLATLAYLL
jgi:hypothetical protein